MQTIKCSFELGNFSISYFKLVDRAQTILKAFYNFHSFVFQISISSTKRKSQKLKRG